MGNRGFQNYESGAYGSIGFAKALEVSCNTFFYRVGYDFWQRFAPTWPTWTCRTRSSRRPRSSASAARPASASRARPRARIADRKWKAAYYKSQKNYYCGLADKPEDADTSDFVYKFARVLHPEEGYAYRAGDAVNFAIGQGDTIVTPLKPARAYGAISRRDALRPRIARAVVASDGKVLRRFKPQKVGKAQDPQSAIGYIDDALKSVTQHGRTMAWRMGGTCSTMWSSAPRQRARRRSTASSRPRGWRRPPTTTSC